MDNMPSAYNLELLMVDGSHYVAIRFSAPFCLHLPDGNYKVETCLQGQKLTVQIVLEKRKRNLSRGGFLPGIQEVEKFADRQGVYCFTSVLVYIPVRGSTPEIHSQIEEISRIIEGEHQWFNQQAIKAFNRLVETYRYCTGEAHINPLRGRDVWMDHSVALFFNELPPDEGKSKFTAYRIPVYDLYNIIPATPDVPDTIIRDIQNKLISDFETSLEDELLLNAYDYLDRGSFKLAIIEAETAFEGGILQFLYRYYHGNQRDIDKIERINTFGTLLKDTLFQKAIAAKSKKFEKGEKRYEEWYQKVWTVRSKLVHGRIANVSPKEATDALQIIEETLEYLVERPRTQPWRYIG